MKKREAEEHEEKEFLQNASPDQQAQQAELDKGIFLSAIKSNSHVIVDERQLGIK